MRILGVRVGEGGGNTAKLQERYNGRRVKGGGGGQTCLATSRHGLLHRSAEVEVSLAELVSGRVLDLETLEGLGELRLDRSLVLPLEFAGNFGRRDGRFDGSDVRLELLLGLVLRGEVLVGLLELLGVLDHLIDLGRRETSDRVGDRDVGTSTRGLVESGNLEETVRVNLEGTDELGLSTGLGGDARELELSEEPVLLAGNALSLVDGEGDGRLVVLDSGEGSGLVGGDGGVAGNDDTEDVSLHSNTERERG